MARTVKTPQELYTIWDSYRAEREDWIQDAANDEDFYMGNQWTQQEIDKLEKRGMAPLVVNRVMPVIQQEMAIFLAKRPTFRYLPQEDDDVEKAKVFSDIASYIWHHSSGDTQLATAIKDYFVTGAGYLLAYVDPYEDQGRGEVRFRHIPVWDVYPDPNSREIDLSDARYVFISRMIDPETLAFAYPDKAKMIESMPTLDGPVTDRPLSNPAAGFNSRAESSYLHPDQKGKLRVIESYRKYRKKRTKIFDLTNGTETVLDKEISPDALRQLPLSSRVYHFWETRIQIRVLVTSGRGGGGDTRQLDEYDLDIDVYPVIPMYLHHNGNPFSKGDVAVIKGMQQEVNKRRSIMIHNATLAGNYRIMAEKGTIANKEDWEKRGSQPGYVLEYTRSNTGDAPRELLPQALPNAWIQLEAEGKNDIEYALSVYAHMMGSSQDAPETYRGLLALEEAGQRKLRFKSFHAREALRRLGLVILKMVQLTYTQPKMLRIIGEDSGEARKLFLNQPMYDMDSGQVVRHNDPTIGRYDLVVEDGSSMPTNRMALLNLYLEMYQLGIIDKVEVLKKTDVVNRDEVISRMGEAQQLQAQLKNMEGALKDLEGLNQTLRRQLQQAEIHMGAQRELDKVKDEMRDTVMEQDLAQARIKDEVVMAKREMRIEAEKQELTLAAALAQANLEIAAAKLAAKQKQEASRE